VGKLREVPSVFSQGETFDELERNIKDAFALMMREVPPVPVQHFRSAELQVDVRSFRWFPRPAYGNEQRESLDLRRRFVEENINEYA